jgi:Domain of unknown function (DUF6378)
MTDKSRIQEIIERPYEAFSDGQEPKAARRRVLEAAHRAVMTERDSQYGDTLDVMKRHTDQLNALGYRGPGGRLLQPWDNAVIEIALKLARLIGNPFHDDNWDDTAGYAAIGHEAVVRDQTLKKARHE